MWTTRRGRTFEGNPAGGKKLKTDTTLEAGRTRGYSLRIANLGGPASEPINVRLDYVYQAPDAVDHAKAPEKPLPFLEQRVVFSELSPCGRAQRDR